jgi:hypothetical protein
LAENTNDLNQICGVNGKAGNHLTFFSTAPASALYQGNAIVHAESTPESARRALLQFLKRECSKQTTRDFDFWYRALINANVDETANDDISLGDYFQKLREQKECLLTHWYQKVLTWKTSQKAEFVKTKISNNVRRAIVAQHQRENPPNPLKVPILSAESLARTKALERLAVYKYKQNMSRPAFVRVFKGLIRRAEIPECSHVDFLQSALGVCYVEEAGDDVESVLGKFLMEGEG